MVGVPSVPSITKQCIMKLENYKMRFNFCIWSLIWEYSFSEEFLVLRRTVLVGSGELLRHPQVQMIFLRRPTIVGRMLGGMNLSHSSGLLSYSCSNRSRMSSCSRVQIGSNSCMVTANTTSSLTILSSSCEIKKRIFHRHSWRCDER